MLVSEVYNDLDDNSKVNYLVSHISEERTKSSNRELADDIAKLLVADTNGFYKKYKGDIKEETGFVIADHIFDFLDSEMDEDDTDKKKEGCKCQSVESFMSDLLASEISEEHMMANMEMGTNNNLRVITLLTDMSNTIVKSLIRDETLKSNLDSYMDLKVVKDVIDLDFKNKVINKFC